MNIRDFNAVPFDLDCNLLGLRSSGGYRGSILGPSRLLVAEGDLIVWEIFVVVDGLVGFADFVGFAVFIVLVIWIGLGEEDAVSSVVGG